RRVAARSIIEGGRLLCLAARLLDETVDVSDLTTKMNDLESRLDQSPRPTPIDEAVSVRSTCLERITRIRMKQQRKAPAKDDADVLLSRLSSALADARVLRDDRGAVVPLERGFDAGATLEHATLDGLSQLVEIARAHPDFPLMLVVHGRPTHATPAADNARRWFDQKGLERVAVFDAGAHLPASVKPSKNPSDT